MILKCVPWITKITAKTNDDNYFVVQTFGLWTNTHHQWDDTTHLKIKKQKTLKRSYHCCWCYFIRAGPFTRPTSRTPRTQPSGSSKPAFFLISMSPILEKSLALFCKQWSLLRAQNCLEPFHLTGDVRICNILLSAYLNYASVEIFC